MSGTIVEVVTVEASTLVVDVIVPPPAVALAVDVIAPPPAVAVVEVVDWASIPITIAQLPIELQMVPVSFAFASKIAANFTVSAPMGFPLTLLPGLEGAQFYAGTWATSEQTFYVRRLTPGGVAEQIGTITVSPNQIPDFILSGVGGRLATGDVLQLTTPQTQDATLQDVGITVLMKRE